MGSRLSSWLTRTFGTNVRRREGFISDVRNALALAPRGGVFRDTLRLEELSTHMQATWIARPLHPWDRDLPAFEQDEAFCSQCLQDVDTAIARLFERFELVASLDIVVLHPVSRTSILTGYVHRHEFAAAKRLSIPMRLRMAGITYEFGRGDLQPTRCA
jgi:hypothetical protein